MLSTVTFRSELTAFRERLISLDDPTHERTARARNLNRNRKLALQALDRLARRDREIETIFQTIRPMLPAEHLARGFFLATVIAIHGRAEGTRRARDGRRTVENAVRRDMKLKETLDGRLQLERSLLGDLRKSASRLLGREQQTRPRNYFMAEMQRWFREQCGQPYDDMVASLTNIVFDLQAPTPAQQQRGRRPPENCAVTADTVRGAAHAFSL
jgi:hypothetical protein